MYCSVTLSKTKKPRWFRKESPALKKPKIKSAEPYSFTHKFHGKEEVHHGEREAKVVGEPITREPRPSYTVKIGESFRDDSGKPKSKQKHINTFSEWDVIDTYLDHQDSGSKQGIGFFIDGYDFDNDVQKAFPDADLNTVWKLVQAKIEPIERRIIAEFKKTDEYKWWLKTKKLKEKLRAEKAKKKAKEEKRQAEYERKSRQQYQESYRQAFNDFTSPSSAGLTLSGDEAAIIKKCYKSMAVQLHPDKGGSDADMAMLNALMDRIKVA